MAYKKRVFVTKKVNSVSHYGNLEIIKYIKNII